MYRYLFTSEKIIGEIELRYNEAYLLTSFEIRAELSESQHVWLLKRFPRELAELEKLVSQNAGIKIMLINEEITFEMFWSKYNEKILSSKKRTLSTWNKMSKSEQKKAYNYIYKYISILPLGVRKKYAETYLNSEIWNN